MTFLLTFFVPESHVDAVKQALFDAGAGQQGPYDCVCWQALGEGQFRPLPGSQPYSGQQQSLQKEREYKVEMSCKPDLIRQAIKALKAAHPYEEPAYGVFRLESVE